MVQDLEIKRYQGERTNPIQVLQQQPLNTELKIFQQYATSHEKGVPVHRVYGKPMDDVDHFTDFKDPKLQKLDLDFRCNICKELFTTPLQLPNCIHNFCAICIRRRLAESPQCPTCRVPADDNKLIRNSQLDECVNSWRAVR